MPGFVSGLHVDHLALEPAALRPPQVHAKEHLGPVLRFRAAGARMDCHDRVLAIVLSAEHLLGLAGVHFLRKIVEALGKIFEDRLAGLRPLDQDTQVLGATPERLAQVLVVFEAPSPLQQLLGGRLVLPEIRSRNTLFYSGEFVR